MFTRSLPHRPTNPLTLLLTSTTLALVAPTPPSRAQSLSAVRASAEDAPPLDAARSLPLVAERLQVTIDHHFAQSVIDQTYHNDAGQQLEATYLQQVPQGTRVRGFAYWNGSTKIVGEVFEKELARRVYENTTGLRRDPGLLESEGDGAFSFRVFPIAAGERKRVQVTLGGRLQRSGEQVEYRMGLGSAAAQIELTIADTRQPQRFSSPTHTLEVSPLPDGRTRLRATRQTGARELVVRYSLAEAPWRVTALAHRDGAHDAYVLVSLTAPGALKRQATAKDVTLVLDRSGSMSGEPLRQARLAAAAVVDQLRPSDRVNVLAFDDGVERLYDSPRKLTAAVRREAQAFITRLSDGGGTNLALALKAALETPEASSRPHLVLFLTDGCSTREDVFSVLRSHPGKARIFTIGLGSGVDRPLLARMASERRGRFVFVESASALTDRVQRLYQTLEDPLLVDVKVAARGARLHRLYPTELPDLTAGEELFFVARASGSGPLELELTGTLAGRRVTQRGRVLLNAVTPASGHPWIGYLWAQQRIEALEQEIALSGVTEELRNEVIEYALAYNLVTTYTSFLAIPERELTAESAQALGAARSAKRALLAAHKDAAALSRSVMPPGDPVLTVRAPANALSVTALFPFGLIKDLAWDDRRGVWSTRFLVPKDVADGSYQTRVRIVHADGREELTTVAYRIDSAEPEFEAALEAQPLGVVVRVTTHELMREVTAALESDPSQRATLVLVGQEADGSYRYQAFLALPAGAQRLRLVVADVARNEAASSFDITRAGGH